ncbi:MAG TPA: sigma-70 family RNA polymerase sigma factor [Cyclobacteriaceae bacterium]|nr:sigma-70 family RNA polymerase sigma factor [Cyclobacteriaceae bacterium]
MSDALIPHLFRTEYRKIVSVLTKRFGFDQLEIAEDIASDTFLTAAETWGLKGFPANPTAWLYNVAKNKAINYLERDRVFDDKITPALKQNRDDIPETELDLSPQNINDSQLQMMFAVCHPSIPVEAQIGLSLRVLCGFGIDEIADAFLVDKDTINKRLFRAKQKLREENVKIMLPGAVELDERLAVVLRTIYLFFNEGYYSVSQNRTLRKDVCFEAIRLCSMLVENASTNKPQVNALLSLMFFHASRFDARLDEKGEPVLYEEQDTARWDTDLIRRGEHYLNSSATGSKLSKYHVEAAIAYWHTNKTDTPEKWENILSLYNELLIIEYSPIAALNRTYALSKVHGKAKAVEEARKLDLTDNHYYFALLGELYCGLDNNEAIRHFEKACQMAKSSSEKSTFSKKIDKIRCSLSA